MNNGERISFKNKRSTDLVLVRVSHEGLLRLSPLVFPFLQVPF